jgi:hypothetical protein
MLSTWTDTTYVGRANAGCDVTNPVLLCCSLRLAVLITLCSLSLSYWECEEGTAGRGPNQSYIPPDAKKVDATAPAVGHLMSQNYHYVHLAASTLSPIITLIEKHTSMPTASSQNGFPII